MRKNVLSQILLVAIFLGIIVIIVGMVSLARKATRIVEVLESEQIAGHDYVDLGLSVKWATCNVGAATPSDYGNYYAWGETETKSEYTQSNYVTPFVRMGSIAGNPQYDAATVNWGGTWRMPTYEEMDELIDKCTWKWVEMDGHKGYEGTGPNGRSIFLPAAGWRRTSLCDVGKEGYYWTALPDEVDAYRATALYFIEREFGWYSYSLRSDGMPVRPVSN